MRMLQRCFGGWKSDRGAFSGGGYHGGHRMVDSEAAGRRLERVAGTGVRGSSGVPGDPLNAELAGPHGVVTHPRTHEIYIADSRNHRVLRIPAAAAP
jgi:hypothetical protein